MRHPQGGVERFRSESTESKECAGTRGQERVAHPRACLTSSRAFGALQMPRGSRARFCPGEFRLKFQVLASGLQKLRWELAGVPGDASVPHWQHLFFPRTAGRMRVRQGNCVRQRKPRGKWCLWAAYPHASIPKNVNSKKTDLPPTHCCIYEYKADNLSQKLVGTPWPLSKVGDRPLSVSSRSLLRYLVSSCQQRGSAGQALISASEQDGRAVLI